MIYETVRAHLLSQMEVSMASDGVCAYRGSRGLKCAIGILIPDEIYDPGMEGDIDEMLCFWPDHPFTEKDIQLMEKLQAIHDRYQPDQWKEKLDELAQSL